jgi:OmpA family protein/ASPM-SPD-2-Hydin domain-containing protein/thrombospondin type 3 repeat protein
MTKRWPGLLLFGVLITGGVAHAAITVTDDPLDLGNNVVVGQPATASTSITADTNTSDVSVAVHGGVACAEFSIVTPTGTFPLNNGTHVAVTVKLAPTSPGTKSCVIDILQGSTVRRSFTASGKAIAPKIMASQTVAFPATDVGQTGAAQTLTLTNIGDSDLNIDSTNTKLTAGGADFTVTLVSPNPLAPIAPTDQASWSITCHPSTFGPRTGTFEIVSDAFGANTFDVTLSCTGNQGVLATDQTTTIQFTAVPRGTTQTRMFTLSNPGNVDVSTVAITVDPANVGYTVDIPTLNTVPAKGTKPITVTFKPMSNADGGPAKINFTGIWGTTPTPTPTLSLNVDGLEASFGLMPAQPALDFGRFRYDTHPQQTFQLLNDGKAMLTMMAPFIPDTETHTQATEYTVDLANGAVPVPQPATLASDDHVTVVVTPQVAHRVGVVSGHIDITPSLGATLHVPVTGVATAAEVDFPETVSFGVVDLNAPPVKQAIAIKNTGSGPLDIMSITPSVPGVSGASSGAFAIMLPGSPRELAPDESLTIEVTYQPRVATAGAPDVVNLNAQLAGSLDLGLSIQISGDAAFFQAHGSGGCDAGGGGRGAGLAIVLTALVAPVVLRRRGRRRAAAGAAAAAAVMLMLAPAARADGIALSVFAPTPATAGEGFALQTPEIGAGGSWVANAVVSYASNPLVLEAPDQGVHSTVVSRSMLMQIGGAYALLGRLELGAHLPLYQQSGDAPMATNARPVKGTATGNLAVHLKARLLRAAGGAGAFTLGASAIAALPTATKDQFTGADQPEGRLLVLASFTPAALDARITISVNAGPVIRKQSSYENITQKSGAAWGGGLSVRILDELWATAELFGETTPSADGQKPMTGGAPPPTALSAVEGLAGLTIKPDRRVSVGLAVGRGVTAAIGTPDLRGVLTVSIVPGAAPLAPIHPSVPDGDADGDGIPDSVDQCPHDPEDKDGFQDADGCPDPDNDHDGIPDAQDKCPLDPEDKDGFEDADGCPDPDNDHDGIPDKLDKCPNEPEDKDGFEDLDGCPDPDNDHDGIPDEKDKCPNEPETINGFQDDDGCPDKGDSTIILSPDKIETLDPIQFTGIKLARGATPLIEQVGATLRAHPEILRVRVTVHVQPTSDPDADQARTDKRAQAVRDWLVQWGVAPARLEVRGFGGSKPLVPPDQRGAAKLNERIEFIILERK